MTIQQQQKTSGENETFQIISAKSIEPVQSMQRIFYHQACFTYQAIDTRQFSQKTPPAAAILRLFTTLLLVHVPMHAHCIGNKELRCQLMHSLGEMIAKPGEVVGEVRSVADSVALGSQAMSASSEQMSQDAAEQASSIEEVTTHSPAYIIL